MKTRAVPGAWPQAPAARAGGRGRLGQLLRQSCFHFRQFLLELCLAAFSSSSSWGLGLGRSTMSWSLTPRSESVRGPLARAATRISTCSGVTARVTVRLCTAFSSGRSEDLPGGQDQDVLEDRLAQLSAGSSRLLEPDDVDPMAGKDEARDARLLVDVDGEGPHSLGDVRHQAGRRSLGPEFLVDDHVPLEHGGLDPPLLNILERGERTDGNIALRHADRLNHVGLEDLLFLEVARGDEHLLRLLLGRAGLLISRRVTSMAPRPSTTARTRTIIDLPFIAQLTFRPIGASPEVAATPAVRRSSTMS